MENSKLILAIDQGTSSTKTLLFNEGGKMVARGIEPLKTNYLVNGFVEQDPEGIYANVLASVEKCLKEFKASGGNLSDISTCGISNQRETFIIWDATGKPLYDAVVWQCKRSVAICEQLKQNGLEPEIQSRTGLIADPYFSGTKLMWLYQNLASVKEAIDTGNAFFGTVDTWLLYKLTGGKSYLTDYTNASRTMLFNLEELDWDRSLLQHFGLGTLNLPETKPSANYFGETDFEGLLGRSLPITAMIGDSHAAAFGEGCFTAGTAKATLGTGCSVLMNIGSIPKPSANGMMTTICWSMEGRVDYAFEGVIVSCGATIEWLKNELGLFVNSKETEAMATAVADNGGVYIVPAFSGLGAPHWDMNRKAGISGLTFGSTKNHIVRAALESIAYQLKDVVHAMNSDAGVPLQELMADGGITSNKFLLQFLADLLQKKVVHIGMADVSALGAAFLAGLQSGIFKDIEQLTTLNTEKAYIEPSANVQHMQAWYKGWHDAIGNR
ncbi:MAG: glycerol kinase GlpK [Chitinophagaceae bacterium]